MLNFYPPEIENELLECLKYLRDKHAVFESDSLPDLLAEDFDPSDYGDEIFKEDYKITIYLDSSDFALETSLRNFIDTVDETKSGRLIDMEKCITDVSYVVRVRAIDSITNDKLLRELEGASELFARYSVFDEANVTCYIVNGLTTLALMTSISGNYNNDYPSVFCDDLYVSMKFEKPIDITNLDIILDAYFFELSATYNIDLILSPRFALSDDHLDDDYGLNQGETSTRLEPLLSGKGIPNLIELYNEAVSHYYIYDFAILHYTKVIEFVATTLIQQEIIRTSKDKVDTLISLDFDANSILNLENHFVEIRRKFNYLASGIELTLQTCCEIRELSKLAPNYLDKLIQIRRLVTSNGKISKGAINSAFKQLANSISNTRNKIVHAKSNYSPKTFECPEIDKPAFSKMLRIIAIQTIRWYSKQPESNRII